MGKVYIVQEPVKRDKETHELVPSMNFSPAMEYGDIVVCLPKGRVSLSPVPMTKTLRDILSDFGDDDYIIPAGDPAAIAVASAIAMKNNLGRAKLLKWDKVYRRYIMVQIDLNS